MLDKLKNGNSKAVHYSDNFNEVGFTNLSPEILSRPKFSLTQTLTDIGLSPAESKVFIALSGVGPSPVSNISKETGIHRANVYGALERLNSKGLISKTTFDNKVIFSASDPSLLVSFLKKKETSLLSILPQLNLSSSLSNNLDIEVFSGLSSAVDLLFSLLKNKNGNLFMKVPKFISSIGLSSKINLFSEQAKILDIDLNQSNSNKNILLCFRDDTLVLIFVSKEFKTLRIVSKELVGFLSELLI